MANKKSENEHHTACGTFVRRRQTGIILAILLEHKSPGYKTKKPAISRAERKNTTDCLQTNNNVCNVGNPTSYPFGYAQKINYKGIILLYIDFVKERYTKYRISNLFAEKQKGQACLLVKGQAGKQALCCTLKKE